MADNKISALIELAEAPAVDDELALVDTSATETKKITTANLMASKVAGPASAVDNRVAVFDQTTGKIIKDGGKLLTDKAEIDQAMHIGTTQVAINRASGTLNLAGIGTLGCGAITAESADFPVIRGTRTSIVTDGRRAGMSILHKTTGDMVDGFGSGVSFEIQDDTAGPTPIANIFAIRETADNSGRLKFFAGLNGATEAMDINRAGNVGIGTTPNANAILDVASTTKAFMPPRMTTAQRDAVASPAAGMVVYNTTTNVLNFHNGSAWGAV